MAKHETLRDIHRLIEDRHPGVSGHALARLAGANGYRISYTILNAIGAGTYRHKPSMAKVNALAWLAGVKRDRVLAAAGLPMHGRPFVEDMPDDIDRLPPVQRRAIKAVVDAMLTAQPLEAEAESGPPLRIAARDTGAPSEYQKKARAQDEAAEGSQDEGES